MNTEKENIYLEYLVLRCRHRDRAAWEDLIGRYEKRLYYFIRQVVGRHDDALNILQETWLKAYYSMHRLREPAALAPWLYTIARHCTYRFMRSQRRDVPLPDRTENELQAPAEPEESFAVEQVHQGLKSLTPAHREVLVLFYMEDFSMQQIAEILKIPMGTVRSRLHYAKRSLKTVLEKEIDYECR